MGEGVPHPRGYGNNARALGRYVRERKVIGLEEAIRKMTSLPADHFGFADRGRLAAGQAADVVDLRSGTDRRSRDLRDSRISTPTASSPCSSTACPWSRTARTRPRGPARSCAIAPETPQRHRRTRDLVIW